MNSSSLSGGLYLEEKEKLSSKKISLMIISYSSKHVGLYK
jgi:hypothetical protein